MRATEFLNNMRELNALISSTREMIDRLNNVGGFSGIGGKCSVRTNTETDKQIKRYELGARLNGYIDDLLIYHDAAVKMIREGHISPKSKIIIIQRYMLGKQWCEVAAFMQITEQRAKQLNGTTIAEVATQPEFWANLPKI